MNAEISKASADSKDASDDERKAAAETKAENEKKVEELRKQETEMLKKQSDSEPRIRQIIDLALLQSGLLKGRELSDFISRSVSLL